MKRDWRKLHNTSLFVLLTRYRLGNQTGNDVMDWVHGTYYKLHTVFEWVSLKVQDHLEDLGVDQKTELKRSCKQMGHIIGGYLKQAWEMSGWLYKGQHGFTPGYSCESQLFTVCQDIVDSPDEGVRADAIIIDFSKTFDLVPHDRLLTKIVETGEDLRVVVRVKEFLLGHSQRVRVDGQLSEEVRVTSGVPHWSVLGPLLFLAYVNDIWKNTESNKRLFADDCVIYRKIMDSSDTDKLQTDLNRLGELGGIK